MLLFLCQKSLVRNFHFQTLQRKFLILREIKHKVELIFLEISKSLPTSLTKKKLRIFFKHKHMLFISQKRFKKLLHRDGNVFDFQSKSF